MLEGQEVMSVEQEVMLWGQEVMSVGQEAGVRGTGCDVINP